MNYFLNYKSKNNNIGCGCGLVSNTKNTKRIIKENNNYYRHIHGCKRI